MPNQITWTTAEYQHHQRSTRWYIILLLIALAILGYAFYQQDYVMFLTFLLLFGVVYFTAQRKPREITITVSGRGVEVGQRLYPYSQLKNFWLVYEPPSAKILYLTANKAMLSDIPIELGEQDPNEVRTFLLKFLQEDLEREEAYSDKLLRNLRF